MNQRTTAYGTTRNRGPAVSYAEIERTARALMAAGERPTVKAVHKSLGRGSPNHITVCMQRFWKDQAGLNQGDPLALSRLPPELADAAVAQWEQALRLSQQTAKYEDNAARAQLEQLRRDTDVRARSVELREKEWDMAARVRERALADAREQIGLLMRELAIDRAELRARDARIADMEAQMEEQRRQLAKVITHAVLRNRVRPAKARSNRTQPKRALTPKSRSKRSRRGKTR
jgi:Plasmid replication region DNA-binding N-term